MGRGNDGGGWPGVDALYGFDPLPAVFEEQGHARMLDCGKVVSVVVATREMVEQRTAELEKFLKAFQMSWHLFSIEPEKLNRIFARESRLDVSNEVLDRAASVEPNRWSTLHREHVFTLSTDDMAILEQAHSFLLERGIINDPMDIPGFVDTRIAERVHGSLREEDLEAIQLATD
jgi:ABC-type nitrate/sulfonate/bicarbonate transport system substrate-binding protein